MTREFDIVAHELVKIAFAMGSREFGLMRFQRKKRSR